MEWVGKGNGTAMERVGCAMDMKQERIIPDVNVV
jgi:hypothetical protein